MLTTIAFPRILQLIEAGARSGSGRLALFIAIAALTSIPASGQVLTLGNDGFEGFTNGTVHAAALQPDGKILVGGNFTFINNTNRRNLARLNPDGSVDTNFSADTNSTVFAIELMPDGNIWIGGSFTTVAGETRNRLARLNGVTGTPDGFSANIDQTVLALKRQADGKLLVGGDFTTILGASRQRIARLNADATLDSSFTPTVNVSVRAIEVESDGKVLIGGSFTQVNGQTRNRIARLAADGSLEGWNPSVDGDVYAIAVQLDGNIVIGGSFTSINGAPQHRLIARINRYVPQTDSLGATGNASGVVFSLRIQADGKILAGGNFQNITNVSRPVAERSYFVRFDPITGTLDSFNPLVDGTVRVALEQPNGMIFLGGEFVSTRSRSSRTIARVHPDGAPDAPLRSSGSTAILAAAVQPDGKIIVGGGFSSMLGVARANLARINADGTLDTSFAPNPNGTVRSIVVQPDGKILIGGDFGSVRSTARRSIARLDPVTGIPDGFATSGLTNGRVNSIALQADGRVLVGGDFTFIAGSSRPFLARLNSSNGSPDSFSASANSWVYAVAVQPDGKILVGGFFSSIGGQARNFIARLDPVTAVADGFNPGTNGLVNEILVQSDGKVVAGGQFTAAGGQARNYIARFDGGTGSLDGFAPNPSARVTTIKQAASGQILIGGNFVNVSGITRIGIARVDVNSGTPDAFTAELNSAVYDIVPLSDGRSIIVGDFSLARGQTHHQIIRVDGNGVPDSLANTGSAGVHVLSTAIQPDGKIVIGGEFTAIGGFPKSNLARLLPDGTLEQAFEATVNGPVIGTAIQPDGKILVAGEFSQVNGQPRNNIARLNADGTLDGSFDPNANGRAASLATLADGSIIVAGTFTSIGGQARNRIARLDPTTGAPDGFNPNANGTVFVAIEQADGKILVGGEFTTIGGQPRNRIARLDAATGSADTWNPSADNMVAAIAVQSDGKILIGGDFVNVGGQTRLRIARLDPATGLADGFNPNADSGVRSISVQADGKILAGGFFTNIGGALRNRLAKLDPVTGSDAGYGPIEADNSVLAIAMQGDGKVFAGGAFRSIGSVPSALFGRLLNPSSSSRLNVTENSIAWETAGTSVQFNRVVFERSIDNGATYTPIGFGTPLSNAGVTTYSLNGVSQPAGQHVLIRARGFYRSGYANASQSIIESVRNYHKSGGNLVTVRSAVVNQSFIVDGRTYRNEWVFDWTPGSTHTLSTNSPQEMFPASNTVRYVFASWSDGGAMTHNVSPTTPTTYTLNLTAQYRITAALCNVCSGAASLTISPPSPDGFYDANTPVTITANVNPGYSFSAWLPIGSGANPLVFPATSPQALTAYFDAAVQFQSNLAGRSFTFNGQTYTAPQTFQVSVGTSNNFGTTATQTGTPGTRYVFQNWSDGGTINRSVFIDQPRTFVMNFETQHQLTTAVAPGPSGSITVDPASPDGYYAAGQSVLLSALAAPGGSFASWTGTGTGSYTGTNNPATVTMNGPITQTAAFQQGPILRADYRLQGNLNNEVPGGPVLTELVGSGGPTVFTNDMVDGYQRQTLRFPFNSGVAINSLGFPNATATLVMLFKFDQVSGRRRLLDFTGGTAADNGAFMLDGRLEGEPTTTTASLANTYIQVVLVRTGTGTLRVYRDGMLRVESTDGGDPLAAGMRFFQDVINNPVQASAGNLARIRLYEGAMTPEQVQALDRVPETPTGEQPVLFFSSRNGTFELYRMNADGTSHRRLTSNMAGDISAKFSPDGTKIVYQRRDTPSQPYQIWTANSDGTGQVVLASTAENNQSPSWRPDGQKILFSRCSGGRCDLYTMNPDGSGVEPITQANTTGDEDEAVFTPDGQKLVFKCSDTNGTNYQICVSNADGSGRQAITNTAAPLFNQQIDVSPNGQKIAFVRNSTTVAGLAGLDIYTANIDGTNVVNITENATADQNPMWSPDGTKIMFTAARGGGINDIWLMNADGSGAARLMLNSADDRVSDWFAGTVPRRAPFDFDGDGRTDISSFKPGPGEWWYLRSSDGGNRAFQFGLGTDVLVPADYTGDGKTDNAFYRNGEWFIQRSTDFSFYSFPFGTATDIPVPADYDGDGKADAAVFRPSTAVWFIQRSSDGQVMIQGFGVDGDRPVPADYDGDGKADVAIFRPSLGQWWLSRSTAGLIVHTFGGGTDKTVPGDYTGDGKADIAVFRPPTGEWFVLRSEDSSFYSFPFGSSTDVPAPGDYDGDGKTDAAVFRPTDTNWYIQRSTAGTLIQQFGAPTDRAVPNVYVR